MPETPSRVSTQAGDACTRVSRHIFLLTDGRVCARNPTYMLILIFYIDRYQFPFHCVLFCFYAFHTRLSLSLSRSELLEREVRIYVDRREGSTNILAPGILEGSKEEPPPARPHAYRNFRVVALSQSCWNNDRRSGVFSRFHKHRTQFDSIKFSFFPFFFFFFFVQFIYRSSYFCIF